MIKRRYISTESLDGVIDLERLRSGQADCLERNAQKFFELTYLSEDLHKVPRGLSRRFKERGPGTILAQSVYRHGGLTLMEMLTPWIVLGPVQDNVKSFMKDERNT